MDKIWIRFDKLNETDGVVIEQNFIPDDPIHGVSGDRVDSGIFITDIPNEPPVNVGQVNILHINPLTNELFWVTESRQLTPEEQTKQEIESLKAQNAQMLFALVQGGLM